MGISPHEVIDALFETHIISDTWEGTVEREKAMQVFGRENLSEVLEENMKAATLLSMGVFYDFRKAGCDHSHIDFAAQLFENGAFQLPAPITIIAPTDERDILFIIKPQDTEDSQGGLSFRMVEVQDKFAMMTTAIYDAALKLDVAQDTIASGWRTRYVAKLPTHPEGMSVSNEDMAHNFQLTCGLIAMLGCKETRVERVPAPEKLNKARDKKGKPRIVERHVITVDLSQAGASGEGVSIGGKKCPHWRRGHLRHTTKNKEPVIIKIAPMYINWSGVGAAPVPKPYVIKG